MTRLISGSAIAAILMFALGFVFYATPLQTIAFATADPAVIERVQATMAALPKSGAYLIPDTAQPGGKAAYASGPIGLLQVVKSGYPAFDPTVLMAGFTHYFVSALLIGLALRSVAGQLDGAQTRAVLGWMILACAAFNLLSNPVWYRLDWTYALYNFAANIVILMAGALVVARWLRRGPTG
jgi:hypothetical protein